MRKHSPELLERVKSDRKDGMSITLLMRKYSLSKTTLWHHIRDIKLSEDVRRQMYVSRGGSRIRSERQWENAKAEASQLLAETGDHWPILLAALYWCEGTKKSGFVFTNTDADMIRVFLSILRGRLGVRDDDLDIMIRTCTPMDPSACLAYWSSVVQLPRAYLRINHNDKQNKSKTKYGMCRITLRKGGYKLKLMHCLIRGVVAKMAPVPTLP